MMEREVSNWSGRSDRKSVQFPAVAQWRDGSSAAVHVSNLSYEGCELQSKRGFVQGETIALALPGRGKIRAQIRWIEGNRAGARFLTGDHALDERRARLGI
jgi:hypothetical protein